MAYEDLKTSLIEEYSNKKPSSDGEIYRKIRQYISDGNLHGELRLQVFRELGLLPRTTLSFRAVYHRTQHYRPPTGIFRR
ncbi:hypothetical protein NUU61_009483 [Penicillium alfredii]|uniref:Uncharacterized protein n=1 Tax=Penicillium alfredii TaxID=1506179 RepID=A0A9W9END7_9EURO|nr:uncharacterized protein NUU61_009483 [Penicillium alfredii]KAJ5084904.1 hypothetical protein NUU61_009483 [Penicillium alfredii]